MTNGKFTDMFEIAIFIAFISVCLFCAFTSLHHTTVDVVAMQTSQIDTRHLLGRDSSGLDYAYLGRPGAYLDASRLSISIGSASADRRATIFILDRKIEAYDMFSLNVTNMEDLTPLVYDDLRDWWRGFSASPEYTCTHNVACPLRAGSGGVCSDMHDKKYVFSNEAMRRRTFNPYHIHDSLTGYLFENPKNLSECKFKLQVVETGLDCNRDGVVDCETGQCGNFSCAVGCEDTCAGVVHLEYHVFVFLGSLVSDKTNDTAQVEYRWYAIQTGKSVAPLVPWVVTD